jgi:hypothetical protein
MSKLNVHLDENNPSHMVVKRLNEQNEKLYGPYHEECRHFAKYCVCLGEKNIRKNYEQVR